jgi:hypothetical protein
MSRISYCALRKIAADESFMDKLKSVDPRVWTTLGGGGLGWLTAAALGAGAKGQLLGAGIGVGTGFGAGHMYKMHKDLQLQKALAEKNAKRAQIVNNIKGGAAVGYKYIKDRVKGTKTGEALGKLEKLIAEGAVGFGVIERAIQGDKSAQLLLQKHVGEPAMKEVMPRLAELVNIANIYTDRKIGQAEDKLSNWSNNLSKVLNGWGERADRKLSELKDKASSTPKATDDKESDDPSLTGEYDEEYEHTV